MLVLEILGVGGLAIAIFVALKAFHAHCQDKFAYSFLSTGAFLATACSLAFLLVGHAWRESALKSHGDALNGLVIMLIGGLIVATLVRLNFVRTNAVYGAGGTVLQLSLFATLAYVGFFILIAALALAFVGVLFGGAAGGEVDQAAANDDPATNDESASYDAAGTGWQPVSLHCSTWSCSEGVCHCDDRWG